MIPPGSKSFAATHMAGLLREGARVASRSLDNDLDAHMYAVSSNKQNIATYSGGKWCDSCTAKSPFDADYPVLQHCLFALGRA